MLVPASTQTAGVMSYIQLLRPNQWTKNAFCLAGVFFSGHFRNPADLWAALATFGCFCAASSATYIFNDIIDRRRDSEHPQKCRRPIASGTIRVPTAIGIAIGLMVLSLFTADAIGRFAVMNHALDQASDTPSVFVLRWAVLGCVLLYFVNNLAYAVLLKHIALFDVLCIALGFVLRLLAGVYAVGVLPTSWITLCTFFLTVFLGFAKRRSELGSMLEDESTSRRPVLSKYTVTLLDYMLNNAAVMTVVCYALFTSTSGKNPTLVVTVPIVFFAVMHYKRLVVLWNIGEEPDWLVLKDLRIQLSILLWLLCYFVIVEWDVRLFVDRPAIHQ
jgi:4-hydroxybenzoate polyprenyltransferase